MSDIDDVEMPSADDVDMDGDGSDEEFGSARPAVVQQVQGPKKSASEMYQKVRRGSATTFTLVADVSCPLSNSSRN